MNCPIREKISGIPSTEVKNHCYKIFMSQLPAYLSKLSKAPEKIAAKVFIIFLNSLAFLCVLTLPQTLSRSFSFLWLIDLFFNGKGCACFGGGQWVRLGGSDEMSVQKLLWGLTWAVTVLFVCIHTLQLTVSTSEICMYLPHLSIKIHLTVKAMNNNHI